jgi:hypothetical protein
LWLDAIEVFRWLLTKEEPFTAAGMRCQHNGVNGTHSGCTPYGGFKASKGAVDLIGVNTALKGSDLIHNVESSSIKFDWDACTAKAIPYKVATLSAVDWLKIE